MSEDNIIAEVADLSCCCASCGHAEIDDIKLTECDGCDLVRYCSDACRELHRPEHAGKCRKRAAELRDELLFKQPESTHMGDCPICSLPLSLDPSKSSMYDCCSKVICNGCSHAYAMRVIEMRLQDACPCLFCRQPQLTTDEEAEKQNMRRVEANDPVTLYQEGIKQHKKGDNRKAFEYWSKAAELGDVLAQYNLAHLYFDGKGVEKDEGKSIRLMEEAAIAGHPFARCALGNYEWNNNGNIERAVKHWIISATQGHDDAIKMLMDKFREGFVSKEKLAVALRAHKAAVDATKSPQREESEVYYRNTYWRTSRC